MNMNNTFNNNVINISDDEEGEVYLGWWNERGREVVEVCPPTPPIVLMGYEAVSECESECDENLNNAIAYQVRDWRYG